MVTGDRADAKASAALQQRGHAPRRTSTAPGPCHTSGRLPRTRGRRTRPCGFIWLRPSVGLLATLMLPAPRRFPASRTVQGASLPRRMMRKSRPVPTGWDKRLVLLAAGRDLAGLSVGSAATVVAPPDESVPVAHVEDVIVTELDTGEDGSDRAREIGRVESPDQPPARRCDHDGRRLSTQRTDRFRSQRRHWRTCRRLAALSVTARVARVGPESPPDGRRSPRRRPRRPRAPAGDCGDPR